VQLSYHGAPLDATAANGAVAAHARPHQSPGMTPNVLKIIVSNNSWTKRLSSSLQTLTGGTGAVGSLVAQWLAAHGARDIVLLGRSGRFPADSPLVSYRYANIELRACNRGLTCHEAAHKPGLAALQGRRCRLCGWTASTRRLVALLHSVCPCCLQCCPILHV